MALVIYKGDTAAHQVFTQGVNLRPRRRYEVQMGNLALANNAAVTTALGTGGAGTCQVIVVHKAAGLGALGHYRAHPDPAMIGSGSSGHGQCARRPARGERGDGSRSDWQHESGAAQLRNWNCCECAQHVSWGESCLAPPRRQTMCGALAIACRCRKRLVCWTILRAVSWVPGTCSMALRSTIISSDSARRLIPAAPLWQGPETAEARAECPV